MNTKQKNIDSTSLITNANSFILGTYKRFPLILTHGNGSYFFDKENKKYLDFCSGIAVSSLGHGDPEISEVLFEQSKKLLHCSNLYYNIPQIELAEKLVQLSGDGKIFFCNSGAEAVECLIKLARSYGSSNSKYEIITMHQSFHGRTMAGISATGQEKVKAGFSPLLEGFIHVPFNSIEAIENAYNEKTLAVLLEGVQGEGGVISAEPNYLLKLREFCDKNKILLLFDAVQCGFFRTSNFQSYDTILENTPEHKFLPDAIAMAKSLGGGVPIGASWISSKCTEFLGYGSHGSTYGGNPLSCSVALKIIEIIERDNLKENIKAMGLYLEDNLNKLKDKFPEIISEVRGLGLLKGLALNKFKVPDNYSSLSPASYFCLEALNKGLLLVPAGDFAVRVIPQFRVKKEEIEEGISIIESVIKSIN